MEEILIEINGIEICYIGQYEENRYWMAREHNTEWKTYSAQEVFSIDPYKRFTTKENCKNYILKQVAKKCRELLK